MSDNNDFPGASSSRVMSGSSFDARSETTSPSVGVLNDHENAPSSPDFTKLSTSNTVSSNFGAPSAGLGISSGSQDITPSTTTLTAANSSYLLEDPKLRDIMLSDVGIECLVARLKQSVIAAKEFAAYVKKRASVESERIQDVKKLSRTTKDNIKKPEGRQGTFVSQLDEMMNVNDRLCDAGHSFVMSLHSMYDELLELAKTNERSRKSLKDTCMRHEKNVIEAEQNAEKAKSKYNSLCEEMERFKDPNKTKFFKSKNTPQHEQELQSKISTAESEYRQKVSNVQKLRKELVNTLRPQNIKELKDHILECDSGISLQIQKYATLNETLALNNGFILCPLKPTGSTTAPLSMKEIAAKVDNGLDFYNDILKIPTTKKLNRPEVIFVQHPYMSTATSFSTTGSSFGVSNTTSRPANTSTSVGTTSQFNTIASPPVSKQSTFGPRAGDRSSMILNGPPVVAPVVNVPSAPAPHVGYPVSQPTSQHNLPFFQEDLTTPKAEQKSSQDYINRENNSMSPSYSSPLVPAGSSLDSYPTPQSPVNIPPAGSMPGVIPSFGTDLKDLIAYEEQVLLEALPVPRVVSQCATAIDRYGLDTEGIYRHAGNQSQIQVLKRMFDTDPGSVDLTQPAALGINDIHAVSGTLKLYFQELPDPLLTQQYHHQFIEAAKIDNDLQRRDAVHAAVNELQDANYLVLRYLMFHLNRVQQHEAVNRMGIIHLGNMWGSVLMATDHDNINEMALQARVVETILYNCDHIFEAE